jgi:hypothetical protein
VRTPAHGAVTQFRMGIPDPGRIGDLERRVS